MIKGFCRFRLRTFLLLVALVAAGTSWWVSWPNRTAKQFAAAVTSRNTDELSRLCSVQDVLGYFDLDAMCEDLDAHVVAKKRKLPDFLSGRADFTLKVSFMFWGKPQEKTFDVHVDKNLVTPGPVRQINYSFLIATADRIPPQCGRVAV